MCVVALHCWSTFTRVASTGATFTGATSDWVRRACAALLLSVLLTGCSDSIQGVQTYDYPGGDMRGGMIAYDSLHSSAHLPPAGGPYSPLWQQCGQYTQPIYPEYAVHSLARGAVWVTYRPDISAAELSQLRAVVAAQTNTLLSPLPAQGAPVVATVWNAQLVLDSAADSRLSQFINTYAPPVTDAPAPAAPAPAAPAPAAPGSAERSVPDAGLGCTDGYLYSM